MKKKYILLFGILSVLVFLSLMPKESNIGEIERISVVNDKEPVNRIKTSGYWELSSVIMINDSATGVGAQNWTWAVSQAWCSGSGTYNDPFLIENTTVSLGSDDYCISIYNSNSTTYVNINNCTLSSLGTSGTGIYLENCYNVNITDCVLDDNILNGISLNTLINGTISGNNVNNNTYGMYLDNCSLLTINGANIIENNTNTGLYLVNSTYIVIEGSNNVQGNDDYGIYLIDSDENEINQNTIDSTNETGIAIYDSDNCTIYYNTISSNTDFGLLIAEDDGDSLNNTIYRNTFTDNGVNGNDSCAIANEWDNGVMGNSWDDYIGQGTPLDGNDDGIGDDGSGTVVTYTVLGSAGAIDNFPLYDDGTEPTPSLSSDDDADELFEDEKNIPEQIDTNMVILVVVFLVILVIVIMFLRSSGISRAKIMRKTRVKGKYKKRKSKIHKR